jgi:hypothetical protein
MELRVLLVVWFHCGWFVKTMLRETLVIGVITRPLVQEFLAIYSGKSFDELPS